MAAYSLSPSPPFPTPFFTRTTSTAATLPHFAFPSHGNKNVRNAGLIQATAGKTFTETIDRRTLTLGFIGAALGMNLCNQNANAAARRPPPPPPKEKKDPNMSAIQAKILASKKRKEAMKEEVARLKEKGKLVN
ncbi:hypothetical protein ACHQM5_027756 [Ranunculus cassubicifolius]